MPLWGADGNGLTQDHLRLFQRFSTKQIKLTFEAEETAKQLREEELQVSRVALPSFPCPVPEIEKALREFSQAQAVPVVAPEGNGYEETETGFAVGYGVRRYEVKGLEKGGVRLKASVKAYRKTEPRRFYLDSVDLYSHRSRILYSKGACGYYGEKEEVIGQDLEKLIELAESFKPKDAVAVKPKAMSEADASEAMSFLKDPQMLERILADFEACGLAGEEGNKLMGYLAAVSPETRRPLGGVDSIQISGGEIHPTGSHLALCAG